MKVGITVYSLFRFNDDPEKYISVEEGFDMLAKAGYDCIDFGFDYDFEKFITKRGGILYKV